MRRFGLAGLLAANLVIGVSLFASTPAHAQQCPALHAGDYAPVVDKRCRNWILQRMDRINPHFGSAGWQLDDHGKRYILVANFGTASGGHGLEYHQIIDRALLVDDADLRVGKARPLREDRVDPELEADAVGLYLEQSYAEAMGMLPR